MSHMSERGRESCAHRVGATVAFAERQIERWAADMAEVSPPDGHHPVVLRASRAAGPGRPRPGPGYRRRCSGGRPGSAAAITPTTSPAGPTAHGFVFADGSRPNGTGTTPGSAGGRLRYLLSGGAALPESTGLFFESIGIPILEGYGLTETAPILTANDPASYRYGTVGKAVAGTELRLDPSSGEIQARGPQLMLGYLDRPADTARVLDAEGWLHTGDVGEFDDAGRLRITGRVKNLLVLATGKNVAPAPIEDAVAESPFIRQAVLLGDGRDATGILLVPDLHALEGRAEVTALLRQEVERLTMDFASYERPRRTVVMPRPLSAEHGELDAAGRPVRAVVIEHFPDQVAELYERSARDGQRPASPAARHREASADPQS